MGYSLCNILLWTNCEAQGNCKCYLPLMDSDTAEEGILFQKIYLFKTYILCNTTETSA